MRIFFLPFLCAFATAVFASEETFKAGSFTFQKPTAFKSKPTPPGGMRAAQLLFTDDKGTAEVIFFYFGQGQGGGTQANVDRWLAAFQESKEKLNSKVQKKKVGSGEVTYVEAEGTYLSGMPGGPKTPQPGTKLLGAILESPNGNVFARMTGPVPTVQAAATDFRKMIESGLK